MNPGRSIEQWYTGVQKPGDIDEALQKLGEAASGVLCVGLVTALCEGPGKAGKGAA